MRAVVSIIIIMLVFILSGCGAKKSSIREDIRGMMGVDEFLKLNITQSPGGTAKLNVSTGELSKLPEGAVFTKQEGQARATVYLEGDTVYVIANCDSLMRVNAELQRKLEAAGEFKTELKEDKKDFKSSLIPFFSGMLCMLIIGFLLKVKL